MYCGYTTRGDGNKEQDHGPTLLNPKLLPAGAERPAGTVLCGPGLLGDVDFSAMKETKPDELFTAWLALPEDQRKPMDAELQDIFELSCEKGFRAIIDEASWQMQSEPDALTKFIETLSALPNHYHSAMVTYLDHPECWRGATRFYHADTLPYWRKRKNMGHRSAAVDDESIQQLAAQIRHYFHRTDGRGKNCIVESFRRRDLD